MRDLKNLFLHFLTLTGSTKDEQTCGNILVPSSKSVYKDNVTCIECNARSRL